MEQSDIKRPNAALINREWFESAKSVLTTDELGKVLVAACNYVILGKLEPKLGGAAGVVFAMIIPALDSDITRYMERCARNAANAKSQRQRVGASGSNSQRVEANTTTTPTPTTTTTPSISSVEVDPKKIEIEKWLIYGYFWSTGSKAVLQEYNAFWNYYEALGWKNNKGAPIISKSACARQWRRQFETGDVPNGAGAWFNAVKECPVPDVNVWHIYAGAELKEGEAVIRLRCNAKFLSDLEEVLPNLRKSLQGAFRVPEITIETLGQ